MSAVLCQILHCTCLPPCAAAMPQRKASAMEPKRHSPRMSAKPAPAKVDARQKGQSDKRVQMKGKKGVKVRQAEVADQQTTHLPAENGTGKPESKLQRRERSRVPLSLHHICQWSLPPFLYNPKEYFFNYFVNSSFCLITIKNIFTR